MRAAGRGKHRQGRGITEFDVVIGRRVLVQRTLRGLTQSELADHLGFALHQVQKYENGANRVTAGRLLQIAQFLKVPVTVFFDGLGTEENGAVEESAEQRRLLLLVTSPEGKRLCRAFSRIRSKETKRRLIRVIEHFAEELDALRNLRLK